MLTIIRKEYIQKAEAKEIKLPKELKKEMFAEKIRKDLKKLGLKNKDLAEKLNKRPAEISKWLAGYHNFTIDTLFEIERVFGITLISIGNLLDEHSSEKRFYIEVCEKLAIPTGLSFLFNSDLSKGTTRSFKVSNPLFK